MQPMLTDDLPTLPQEPDLEALANQISFARLKDDVETLAYPRHYLAEPEGNQRAAAWIESRLVELGFDTMRQGRFSNIIAHAPDLPAGPAVLIGAHYDSVPRTPGADDNASAVAAMLECARVLVDTGLPVVFVAFNREEDDLMGSNDFVTHGLPTSSFAVHVAHVLEMLGYASDAPGSQRVPEDLPITLPDQGNFVGVVGDDHAALSVQHAVQAAGRYARVPAVGLTVPRPAALSLRVLHRSDHAPFWSAGIGACMWTDTAEYRNPNYHLPSDRPETLNYRFLTEITRCLVATVALDARTILKRTT